ncbi:hypothetical protein [Rhizobium alvei]|uniref:Uncharacterized protein n=1 Tax=Rhizobium alvei TaxID=1132659 RepID=A0ABT8YQL9_9HYPH|nr:hypothetical protein [Rhizobium alvei]MDO6965811.1 hypothetical protein [Rhizobium alvei]
MAEIRFDASEFEQLGRAFRNLPGEIKAKAMARAMSRMRDMARTRIIRLGSDRIDIPQKHIRERATAYFNSGSSTIEVVERSGWIALYELGASQTRRGVSVKLRGSYRHAFIAAMGSGHKGVMRRVGSEQLPIRELFGPNPAHDITNNPDDYLDVMEEIIEQNILPRVIHEIDRLLPR